MQDSGAETVQQVILAQNTNLLGGTLVMSISTSNSAARPSRGLSAIRACPPQASAAGPSR